MLCNTMSTTATATCLQPSNKNKENTKTKEGREGGRVGVGGEMGYVLAKELDAKLKNEQMNVLTFLRLEDQYYNVLTLSLNVLYHTIPHKLCRCEVKDVHGL